MRVTVLLLAFLFLAVLPASAAEAESSYSRVMRTGTIRCGYVVWAPTFMKDPNTGAFSGIFYEYMEAVGKSLGLKIEWVEETTPAGYVVALRAKRFDVLCSADWPNSSRGKYLDYVDPVFYLALVPFAREGDLRFDNNVANINAPNVTISTIDGEMSSIIARQDFPKAKTIELPQAADSSQMLMNVASGKADIVIAALTSGLEYQKKNTGKLRRVPLPRPIRLFPNTLSLNLGEDSLRQMLNTATQELHNSGMIDAILNKYEERPNSFFRVQFPYREMME